MAKQKKGHCPQCGGDDIDYQGVQEHYQNETLADYERKEIEYVFECGDCGCKFVEVYKMRYNRTEELENEQ